ncbi:MAG: 4Fe-4S binding protein [Steroidobacteraceae bacterium]|jgi:NosR/NirI family nitrous oxide reductase transcriptional regulator|nr:4Fe-4S binding protein [Steroidobacteraceae bacterium]
MKSALHWLAVTLLMLASTAALANGRAYEAPLPAGLSTDPDLCAHAPCGAVLPGADSYSMRKGRPPYVEAYRTSHGERRLVGYVFLSSDILDTPGYSGQPIVTLIGMDTRGLITGAEVLRHTEPILLLGIPESALTSFIRQYVGKYVGDKIEIGRGSADAQGVDAITGATVTVIAENHVIMGSAAAVARQVGILEPVRRPQVQFTSSETKRSWRALLDEGAVQRLRIRTQDVAEAPSAQPYIDIRFGYLNAPIVGEAILGEHGYRRLMEDLEPNEHAIFVVANGRESFKGSGFVRGGIFDRIHVSQETDTFTFRDQDYVNLYEVRAAGAPRFRESAIFIVRSESFTPAYPWSLVFLANSIDTSSGERTFKSFEREYWLPSAYIAGGRPAYQRPAPLWTRIWRQRAIEIGLFALVLFAAGALYASRDYLVRRSTRKDKRWVNWPKYALWTVSVGFIGFHLMAQPSITQVLTWFHAILFDWQWALFLSDPFLFIFWIFIIVTVFFWGRGMFCGWLCPYGAMSEIIHRLAGAVGLGRFQFKLRRTLHDRLKWLKYFVFAGLLAVSFYSLGLAERLAEIEPFKTTFLVGVWNRSWPFVAFWTALFVLAIFIERPFCKYLCPLGAGLAIPSTFRWWGLKRKQECTTCHACAAGCHAQAIDQRGRIDQRECLLCLDCMVMYYDDHACPPLVKERKQRAKAGVALTRIGADGYFVPLDRLGAGLASTQAPARRSPAQLWQWLRRECIAHLLPWNRQFLKLPVLLRAAGLALAVLVTWVWLLGVSGRLGPGIILAWWLAWSVYELITRMQCKPWVKEGPWWGSSMRRASWADMAAYVSMKNLLIGAALFLVMRSAGLLDLLHDLESLQWPS